MMLNRRILNSWNDNLLEQEQNNMSGRYDLEDSEDYYHPGPASTNIKPHMWMSL